MEDEVKEPAPKYNYISPAEYLTIERAAEEKSEYYDGQIYAMSGASRKHNIIAMNLYTNIGSFLQNKNCQMFPSDMRVSTPSHNSYMYPDAMVVCNEQELEDDKFDTLLNPAVIFEILSPSTRSIDKGRKFLFYQQIHTLREYIMIDSLKRSIQVARKQVDGSWKSEELNEQTEYLHIQTIEHQLPLSKIYNNTGL